MKPRNPSKARSLQTGHYVFAGALAFRLFALGQLTLSPVLRPNGGDMLFYHQWAQRILHGQLTDHAAFYGLPLYAYWLAALYKLLGVGVFVPILVQAVAEAGTATLIYKTGEAVFTGARRAQFVAVLAAVGWVFYVPAQAYSVVLMPASFAVFVFWLAVWQVSGRRLRCSLIRWTLLALVIGFSAMAVASVLFVLPLLLAAIILRSRAQESAAQRNSLSACAAILLGVVIGTSPCWLHNFFIARDPVFLSAHSGVNFWVGNNPDANGYPHFPGLRAGQAEMLDDSIAIAESAAGRQLKRSEISDYWSAKARNYIQADPAGWLHLLGRKFANFWNAFEYDDVGVSAQLRHAGVIFPGLHFGIVAALAIPGSVLALRRFPLSRWIAAAVLLQMISVLMVFVTERYRLAAVPGLLLFGAFGVVQLYESIAAAKFSTALTQTAMIGLSALLISAPRKEPSLWALTTYNAGRQALETGDEITAENQLNASLAYVPGNAETNLALGNLRLSQHDRSAARVCYLRALQIEPLHKRALSNLAVMALEDNQPRIAERYLRDAVSVEPLNAKSHYLLARALLAEGNKGRARIEIDRAIELAPAQPEFLSFRDEIANTAP